MPSFAEVTSNKNFLSPLGYKFVLNRLPNVDYFCQTVRFPGVSIGTNSIPNPFIKIPVAGTELNYGNLSITFKVDEDINNYKEIYDWLVALGFPENFAQYKAIGEASIVDSKKIRSDASLVILSSSKNPKHEIKFYDVFPVSLSGFQFDSTQVDVNYLEATAEFSFRYFVLDPTTTKNYPNYQ